MNDERGQDNRELEKGSGENQGAKKEEKEWEMYCRSAVCRGYSSPCSLPRGCD